MDLYTYYKEQYTTKCINKVYLLTVRTNIHNLE